jgi:hypothetical protein
VTGDVARIGGRVDQLVSYRKSLAVTDFNVLDGGFGSIKKVKSSSTLAEAFRLSGRRLRQEAYRLIYGTRIPLDRQTIEMDAHFISQHPRYHRQFDAVISSNVIEHSPNPISLLLQMSLLGRATGSQFHAIPCFRYTWDRYRAPTKLSHLIDDFDRLVDFSDDTHNKDYFESAVERSGYMRHFHNKYPVKYPFIHFHVFDEDNAKELFSYIFTNVRVELLILSNNTFNERFLKKYGDRLTYLLAEK